MIVGLPCRQHLLFSRSVLGSEHSKAVGAEDCPQRSILNLEGLKTAQVPNFLQAKAKPYWALLM